MPLSHYSQSKVSSEMLEPIHQNLYEVTFLPPDSIKTAKGFDYLIEHVKTVSGLQGVNPSVDAIVQKYKWSDRSFAGMPSQTYLDISITFTMNLNKDNQAYTYKILRDWWRLTYDPDTAYAGLKMQYTGTMTIVQFNRNGDVYRELRLDPVFPTGQVEALDTLDYESAEPQEITMTFRCDKYEEILK